MPLINLDGESRFISSAENPLGEHMQAIMDGIHDWRDVALRASVASMGFFSLRSLVVGTLPGFLINMGITGVLTIATEWRDRLQAAERTLHSLEHTRAIAETSLASAERTDHATERLGETTAAIESSATRVEGAAASLEETRDEIMSEIKSGRERLGELTELLAEGECAMKARQSEWLSWAQRVADASEELEKVQTELESVKQELAREIAHLSRVREDFERLHGRFEATHRNYADTGRRLEEVTGWREERARIIAVVQSVAQDLQQEGKRTHAQRLWSVVT